MASIAFANIAATAAAGYSESVTDRGAAFANPAVRFEVTLEKLLVGEPTSSGVRFGPSARARTRLRRRPSRWPR